MIDFKDIMPIDGIDDWEMRIKRQDAVWDNEVLDRPMVDITYLKLNPDYPFPESKHASYEEAWLDVDYQVQFSLAIVMNTAWEGDALPLVFPNLGPDFFAACYGGELVFKDITSFIKPFLNDWADMAGLALDRAHPYFQKMEALYDATLAADKNRFYTGWPDLHGGADCLVGFRGPQPMAMDLYDNRDFVRSALSGVTSDFLQVYDHYYHKLSEAGQPCAGWPFIVSSRKWHVPSCDFSYMISPADFDDFFLPGLRKEIRHMEAKVYHRDGPGSLNHLDSLLAVQGLNMIQWVYGEGNGRATDHLGIFKKIQSAGKSIQIQYVDMDEVDTIIDALKPNGVWMHVNAANDEEARAVLKKVKKWT